MTFACELIYALLAYNSKLIVNILFMYMAMLVQQVATTFLPLPSPRALVGLGKPTTKAEATFLSYISNNSPFGGSKKGITVQAPGQEQSI